MKHLSLLFALSTFPLFASAELLPDKYWPSWRGADSSGSTQKGSYAAKFTDSENVIWKAELPGKGCSTPVVWDEKIFLTSAADGQDAVLAYNWSGKKLWQTEIGAERKGKHRNGSGSNPSVVTDGKSLFSLFKSGNLAGLDVSGKVLWKKNLQNYGKDSLYWDFGTSPVLTSQHVIVALMRHKNSWLIALDKKSGEVAWEVERNYETPREADHSYATPIIRQETGNEVP